MQCRAECGACCIAPSIVMPYLGMPQGKKSGEVCVHLNLSNYTCSIWGSKDYPKCCKQFSAEAFVCGETREQALILLESLEAYTYDK